MQIYSANFTSNLAETVITFNAAFLSYSKLDDIAFPLFSFAISRITFFYNKYSFASLLDTK